MIRLTREAAIPAVLTDEGPRSTKILCDRHDTEGDNFKTLSIDFPSAIYSHASVKEALGRCQNGKCCYSELKFPADYPEVEHFRPKGAVNKGESKTKNPWGYYWLAHKWENLLLCKSKINRKYKRNFFPLSEENGRAKKYDADLAGETPLLVNPYTEDPRDHIRFHKDEPYPLTERGRLSIKYYGLRDPDIVEYRKDWLEVLNALQEAIFTLKSLDPSAQLIVHLEARLVAAVKPTSQFSSMAMDLTGLIPIG